MSNLPFNIPVAAADPLPVAQNLVVPTVVQSVSQLARLFNLKPVQIIRPTQSNFDITASATPLIRPTQSNFDITASATPPDAGLSYTSSLKTIVLVDLTFHGQTYTNELGVQRTFPDIKLQAVLISMNQTKNIVETQIQGRKGTIKEYIGMGDYQLSINAIITGPNGVYPRSDVQNMITMLECPNAITVTSWFLNMFLINAIAVKEYDINQVEGAYSLQTISITATSDDQVDLMSQ